MDKTDNIIENILKSLPEPDVYQMPKDFLDRQMLQMWPRMVILDRFTWVAKLNVLIYRWAKGCRPYLTGEVQDIPDPVLSSVLRPSRNRYENAVMALAETLGKFRPGEVPIDLADVTLKLKYSTDGTVIIESTLDLAKCTRTANKITIGEEAISSYIEMAHSAIKPVIVATNAAGSANYEFESAGS